MMAQTMTVEELREYIRTMPADEILTVSGTGCDEDGAFQV